MRDPQERIAELLATTNRYLERARAAEATLAAERDEHAQTARNRDMWKGQCERQADELRRLRGEVRP